MQLIDMKEREGERERIALYSVQYMNEKSNTYVLYVIVRVTAQNNLIWSTRPSLKSHTQALTHTDTHTHTRLA